MRLDQAEDLSKFVDELKRETDRGLPLVGAALIDEKLLETLQSFFCNEKASEKLLNDGSSPLGTFSSRIELCFALGLIDEFEYREISLLRKVRNAFAHAKHGTSFQTEKIKGFCSTLKSDLPEGEDYPTNDPRFRLTNAIVCLALRLYYRPDWVLKERREPKTWVTVDEVSWRRMKDEKPPKGTPVLVMAKPSKE
ncbi:MAG: MltR family transcriptional regulator [Sedimenticola sp.]